MATSFYANISVKKPCPYMEKCYRKNPIHFNEMSHPHLEKIVKNQLEDEIRIPEKLDFECSDRSLLLDQLKLLQIVLRKERYGSGSNAADKLSVKFTEKDSIDKNNVNKVKEDLDNLEIVEESTEKGSSSRDRKRNKSSFGDNERGKKKSKSSYSKCEEGDQECTQSPHTGSESAQSSGSTQGISILKLFRSCNSAKSRNTVRAITIKRMKEGGFDVSLVEPGNFAMKHALSAPYHLFFTRVEKSKPTYDQQFTVTFPEILDISLGEIVNSLQINFMVNLEWLCLQYLLACQSTDMLILYGERVDDINLGLNITMIPISMPTKFGCHHTKVMMFKYKNDGIRVVVSTANLYADDWDNRTQGLWISPLLPPLPESANPSDGESPTGFKKDLERYLNKYRQPALTEWTSAVRRADFSSVNVFFLASIPGRHKDLEKDFWGHRKLGSVLSKHAKLPPDSPRWTLVAQSSSIGSLGPNYESWLRKEIVSSMSKENPSSLKSLPSFQFIYPTINNYKRSFDGQVGSSCLPYRLLTHSKQTWVESYMYQWKATRTARDRAIPHIKSYTRFSPDFKEIPWFVLTSANLSKAAWGTSGVDSHYILNYEAGVVFIPKFVTGSTTFPVQEEEPGVPVFPIAYDLPPTKYESDDKPFVQDFFFE
ncbi:PREDICTED: probable tyrosyl-DNA phosphodiesterase [Habropoda laboriosa]|uniref:probable tyrosyl-DNA phosphodiesterase n=1 Tax=Habropoda laboriosa TaxID=597456 RepID=UPI00083D905F|nr:PREDICTED: probable tyrosyl-DNA phosphodiesterase [Habropoda laboriosa]